MPSQAANPAVASPDTPRSTSDRRSEVLRRVSGECPARLACAPGAVSEAYRGQPTLNPQPSTLNLCPSPQPSTLNSSEPHHQVLSASHWQRGTCGACDSLRLDCAKPLLGVQISIPGSDRVRPPWRIGVPRQFSRYSCTSASSCPRLKADLRPCRAFSLLLASRALRCLRFQVGPYRCQD